MDGCGSIDEVLDDLEVVWTEDFDMIEVGDEKRVGRRGWLYQWGDGR